MGKYPASVFDWIAWIKLDHGYKSALILKHIIEYNIVEYLCADHYFIKYVSILSLEQVVTIPFLCILL